MGVCTDRIELKKRNDLFRDAAENSLAIQERANRREDQLNEEIKKREEKLRATEARCIDLLQLKMGYERDIARLRNEVATATEAEEAMRGEWKEMKQLNALAVRKAEKSIQEMFEEKEEAVAAEKRKRRELEEENKKEVEELSARWREEREALEKDVEAKQSALETLKTTLEARNQEQLEETKKRCEDEIKSVEEACRRREQELCAAHQSELDAKLNSLREALLKEAETARGELEMKMVRQKERVITEQEAVFKRELDEGKAKAKLREEALRSQHEQETRDLHALMDKENEEYRRVIADLHSSIDAKDKEMALRSETVAALEAKVAAQQDEVQTLQRALALVQSQAQNQAQDQTQNQTQDQTQDQTQNQDVEESARNNETIPPQLLELAKEQEKKEKDMEERIAMLTKEVKEKEEALKKAEENLEVERAERKDESKRLSDAR